MELKPCPCGKVPKKLLIGQRDSDIWTYVSGDCCGIWEVEFSASEECMKYAIEAWNDAPRQSTEPLLNVQNEAYKRGYEQGKLQTMIFLSRKRKGLVPIEGKISFHQLNELLVLLPSNMDNQKKIDFINSFRDAFGRPALQNLPSEKEKNA